MNRRQFFANGFKYLAGMAALSLARVPRLKTDEPKPPLPTQHSMSVWINGMPHAPRAVENLAVWDRVLTDAEIKLLATGEWNHVVITAERIK